MKRIGALLVVQVRDDCNPIGVEQMKEAAPLKVRPFLAWFDKIHKV